MAIQPPFIIDDGGVFPLCCGVVSATRPANDFDVLPRDGPVHRNASGLVMGKVAAATFDRIWFESGWAAA